MSYDAAIEVRSAVAEMLERDKSIVMVAINNDGGEFGILVGTVHAVEDVEVPAELDNIPIRVIKVDYPSPFEPRD